MFEWPAKWLVVWWGLWVFQSWWCCYNVNLFLRRTRKQGEGQRPVVAEQLLGAAVVVPVKGVGERFDEHVKGLLEQEYPRYRVIFVVEDEGDAAYEALRGYVKEGGASGCVSVDLVVAGLAERGGQKVHNQLAGLGVLGDGDEAVVFADADAVPDELWLRRLVVGLRRPGVGVTTGYRWFVPEDGGMASRMVSVMNSSVATLMGPARRNFAWGGSMAMKREVMEEAGVAEHWEGALSDDYQVTRAVSRAGRRVYFVMRCLVASPVRMTWGGLFEFGRRQYLITRVHAPVIWGIGLFGTTLYVGGMVWALSGLGWRLGWGWGLGAWGAVVVGDRVRAWRRKAAVGEVFGQTMVGELGARGVWRLENWGTGLVMGVHWLIVLSSAWGRTIRWAGVKYRMRGRRGVEVMGRGG